MPRAPSASAARRWRIFRKTAICPACWARRLRKQHRLGDAEQVLRETLARSPDYPKAHEELGAVLLLARRPQEARPHLERALALDPRLRSARLKLSTALAEAGEAEQARTHLQQALDADPTLRTLGEAAEHYAQGRLEPAEVAYRAVLAREPDQVDALRGLGNVARRAASISRRRGAAAARGRAGAGLRRRLGRAGAGADRGGRIRRGASRASAAPCALEPQIASHHLNLGNALARAGQLEATLEALEHARALEPDRPGIHLALGNALKTVGRHDDAVAAYRRSIALRPDYAEGYWSLSNLKTFRFSDAEVAAMEALVAAPGAAPESVVHLSFALGQAWESRGQHARAFAHYQRGNEQRRGAEHYDPVQTEQVNDRIVGVFTPAFIAARAGLGDPDPAPILIVGLPRSGSTLIEQILASHSMIEGTQELPSLGRVIHSIARGRHDRTAYPEVLEELEPAAWADLGARYLEHTQRYRRGAPRFIDKMPNNFPSVGLPAPDTAARRA